MTAARTVGAGSLWHVTVLVTGDPAPIRQLGRALRALCDLDPGNLGVRYRADAAELQFWDEGPDIAQVAVAAALLWQSSRAAAGLPDWSLVGLEVHDRNRWRERQTTLARPIAPGSVARQP